MAYIKVNDHKYARYYKSYIDLVSSSDNFIDILELTHKKTNELLDLVTEEKGNYTYAEGKWTIKELLVHLIDAERIFCNRALRFARNDKTDLPGFDHDNYVLNSRANERSLFDIICEFDSVRNATINLFKGFNEEMLERKGKANNNELTVLAIAYIIAGHETHHIKVLAEKYLS